MADLLCLRTAWLVARGINGTWIRPHDNRDGTEQIFTIADTPKMIMTAVPETGWETNEKPPESTPYRPKPPEPPRVIVTETPTIISIHTEMPAPPVTSESPSNQSGPGGPDGRNTNISGGGNSPTGPAPASPQPTSGGDILTEIISRIGNPKPSAHTSTQPAPPTGDCSGPVDIHTLAVDELITLGPVTLTLTPGLSTTVGTGPAATFIELIANTAGQTTITVSSSGTAVTATVTNAPITMTLPKTGFEANITGAARPGEIGSTSIGGVAATASSKGGAIARREIEWWIAMMMGIVGSCFTMMSRMNLI